MAVDRDTWFKFFPSDWRGDEALRLCSLESRGLWLELMCLAHRADGCVLVGGEAPTPEVIARLVSATPAQVRRCLKELTANKVCSVSAQGVLYSRRMVKDAHRRAVNKVNGKRGGNPVLVGDSVNRLTTDSDKTQRLDTRNQIPETRKTVGLTLQPAANETVIYEFPTSRRDVTWVLTKAQMDEWAAVYRVDVLAEVGKAFAWCCANPDRRKTAKGMPKFLVAWLNRAAKDAEHPPNRPTPFRTQPSPVMDFDWEEECRRVCKEPCATAYVHSVRKPVAS
jgi:hypothetical protein